MIISSLGSATIALQRLYFSVKLSCYLKTSILYFVVESDEWLKKKKIFIIVEDIDPDTETERHGEPPKHGKKMIRVC